MFWITAVNDLLSMVGGNFEGRHDPIHVKLMHIKIVTMSMM